jgi:hypothetical protein
MLKRVYNLKNDIQLFVEMKEYRFPHFEDKEWMCDFAFLVDITQHLKNLNMFDKINAFESKLKIWNKHLCIVKQHVTFCTPKKRKPFRNLKICPAFTKINNGI